MEQLANNITNLDSSAGGLIASISKLVVEYTFSVIGAVVLLIVGFIVAGQVRKLVYSGIMKTKHGDQTLAGFISKAARYAVLALVVVMVLSQFGVQTASIIAALGAAGLAIGLALQGTLQNVASGLVLMFLRPFKVGDYIESSSVSGVIQEIGLFATELTTLDGLYVLAPNSEVWGTPITNFSREKTRRFDLAIGIGYDDDIDKAMKVMLQVVSKEDRILPDPEPFLFVDSLGDSAVGITCRVWINTSDWWATTRDLTKNAKQAFDKAGISIPFPQRDVHIYNEKAA
ncbi:MAG: mechanosensitive ion channel domain-containing protein [Pseudomonadota bacterium]